MSLSDLVLTIEEADVRLVPHAIHTKPTGAKRCVILSGSTCIGSGTLLQYVLEVVILWKQIIHQRTNSVECANFLGQTS